MDLMDEQRAAFERGVYRRAARAMLMLARTDFAIRRDGQLTPDERLAASLAAASAETGDQT